MATTQQNLPFDDLPAPSADAGTIQAAFEAFHAANPAVYQRFYEAALALKRRGRKRYSAKAIYEHMRYHLPLPPHVEQYKLDNNFTSRYARKLLDDYPDEFAGFLELRRLRTE